MNTENRVVSERVIPRESLYTLEAYAKARPQMRADVIAAKKLRRVFLGEHITLIFESELLIRYQIQEMLRIEKTFEEAGIEDELAAYRPLVPDAHNWIATMQIEYDDEQERKRKLRELIGIERQIWMQVGNGSRIQAIADEDLERETAEKTSAIHFLRFNLSAEQAQAAKAGEAISVGVEHAHYPKQTVVLGEASRLALVADLSNGV